MLARPTTSRQPRGLTVTGPPGPVPVPAGHPVTLPTGHVDEPTRPPTPVSRTARSGTITGYEPTFGPSVEGMAVDESCMGTPRSDDTVPGTAVREGQP